MSIDSDDKTRVPKGRWSRNRWTLLAFTPCALVALAYLARSAWWAFVREHSKWDDYLLVGVVWLFAAIGTSVLLRVVWAVIAPERFLPRWLAVTVLALAAVVGLMVLMYVWYASAWGP